MINNIKNILKDEGFDFKKFNIVASTMDTLKELVYNNEKNYFVIANSQLKGRGRRGSYWESPEGNIYISFNLKLLSDIKNHFVYNALTSLSVSQTVDDICNLNSNIKWPNDIIIKGKKISGIITEILNYRNQNYIIIGVGINLNSSPKINNYPTTCLKEFNSGLSQFKTLEIFIVNLFKNLKLIRNSSYNFDIIKEYYKSKLLYLKKNIKLEVNKSEIVNGTFEDINLDGSMLIKIKGINHNLYSARIIDASN